MSKNYQKSYSIKALNRFLENSFEIAFGDDAINKEYTMHEVIERIKEFAELSNKYDELFDLTYKQYNSIEDFEKAKKEFIDEQG